MFYATVGLLRSDLLTSIEMSGCGEHGWCSGESARIRIKYPNRNESNRYVAIAKL